MNAASSTDFDARLVSAESLSDPYPLLREMREADPVYWSEAVGARLRVVWETNYED